MPMQRLQAFKFELQPTGEQVRSMRRFAGNARKVWNLALDKQQQNHAAGEKFTHAFGMNNWLPAWKTEYPYLAESLSQTLQQVMGDLARAYTNFFARRAAFPRFKRRGYRIAFASPKGSSSINPTAASSCRNSAGFAIATAGISSAQPKTSPCRPAAVSGL